MAGRQAYRTVFTKLDSSPDIHSTNLIDSGDQRTRRCAAAVKEILEKGGVVRSIPKVGNAIGLNRYCGQLSNPPKPIFVKYGRTPISQVPDGALCFWDDVGGDGNGHLDGHTAFIASDNQGRYMLGNTEGQLKYRAIIGKFRSVTNYYLPAGS